MVSEDGTDRHPEDRVRTLGVAAASGHSDGNPPNAATSVSPANTNTGSAPVDFGESADSNPSQDGRAMVDAGTSESTKPRERMVRGTAAPDLVVNTADAAWQCSTRANSSSRISPLEHGLNTFAAATASEAQTSPTSAGTRERGFSLRRAMLARNVYNDAESSNSVAGVPLPGSRRSRLGMKEQQRMPDSPKKWETTIKISPVLPEPDRERLASRLLKPGTDRTSLPHYETWLRSRVARSDLLTSLRVAYKRVHKKILGIQELPPSKDGRHVSVNVDRRKRLIDGRTHREHIDNEIRSCKYTAWNFLPRQLYAQFSKLANFYFLSVSILQMVIAPSFLPENVMCAESRDISQI
ncbi:MAG: hypothetical protein Q9185_000142 [Variospora sp. 1 TL-2023]